MEKENPNKVQYVDDTKEEVGLLISERIPWLVVGLIGAILASFIVSRFEDHLEQYIELAFFLPLIVYLSDAVGTQTQTIFVRNLARPGSDKFSTYLLKEFFLGIVMGLVLGTIVGGASFIWLKNYQISLTVGLAILVNLTIAPIVALFISAILSKTKTDPALGSGPFATIIQDVASILIYFLVASLILFS